MSDIPSTPLPAAQAEVTLAPTATNELDKRQQVVTLSLTASQAPTATPSISKSFPVAVAIPALVGGMALAIGGFLLYWWISKRRRREKKLRWERHQRRQQRNRANTATSRPSISGQNSSGPKSPINEKNFAPPVPALPKHAHQSSYGRQEQGYGQYNEHQNYPQQPSIDQSYTPSRGPEPQHTRDESVSYTAPLSDDPPAESSEKSKSKSSKSAARVAAAEKAAEAAHGDINTRYQPKKPSPLALKAQERATGDVGGPKWGDGPFRSEDSQLQVPAQERQISGEWGVALGSPNHDAQEYSYANDPHLDARAKSGVYSHDPYSAYHNEEDVDYHQVADKMGLDGRSKQSWV